MSEVDANFKNSENLEMELQVLQQQVPPILDDFKKAYLFYNKNPQNNEYQQNLQTAKSHLNDINSKLFILGNDVETNTEAINKKLIALDILIKNAKEKNKELNRKLFVVDHKYNVSDEMMSDYKLTYNTDYLRNWGLLLSIIVVGLTITKVFHKPIHVK
jgi:hypothetical protein